MSSVMTDCPDRVPPTQ